MFSDGAATWEESGKRRGKGKGKGVVVVGGADCCSTNPSTHPYANVHKYTRTYLHSLHVRPNCHQYPDHEYASERLFFGGY